jgi:hypothetical protein
MWGRRKPRDDAAQEAPRPLREALREARIEAAERTGVVVEMRDAELARLEILDDELDPVFAEVPSHIELFDRGISWGEVPRLWIDAVAHVEMGRDKRSTGSSRTAGSAARYSPNRSRAARSCAR